MKKADVILSADIHGTEKVPICRTDEYTQTLFSKLVFINKLAKKHSCPFIIAGDIFDKSKVYIFSE